MLPKYRCDEVERTLRPKQQHQRLPQRLLRHRFWDLDRALRFRDDGWEAGGWSWRWHWQSLVGGRMHLDVDVHTRRNGMLVVATMITV